METIAHSALVCGIDTHADILAVAVVDGQGRIQGVDQFPATAAGHKRLMQWMAGHGRVTHAGVEGTASYGKGVTQHLQGAGITVVEVIRPNRQVRRLNGKSDPTDAVAAARAVLSGEATAIPKSGDGPIEAIRAVRIARQSAIKARTQAANQIRDLILTAPICLRDQLQPLTTKQRVQHCARLRPNQTQHLRLVLRSLAHRHQALTREINTLTTQLTQLTKQTAPTLYALKGVGPDVAAKLLIAAGDNPHRIRNERAFAALCGVSPVDASSGKQRRHRLNRGGNRQANNALWTIALVRMSTDPKTRAYVTRRTQQGLTKPEIIRCLKRYIARETHKAITHDLNQLA